MKFTTLFGRPTNRSCYASRVLLNRRRGLALKSDVVIVTTRGCLGDFLAS